MSSRLGAALAVSVAFVVLAVVGMVVMRSVVGGPAGLTLEGVDASAPAAAPFAGLTEARLALGGDCLRVVVADEPGERHDGLRDRTDLGPYDAMLFVFPTDTTARFTMAGVDAPLAIGWYDAAGRPVGAAEMEPCPGGDGCPSYGPPGRYRYALETPPGALGGGALGPCA